MASTDKTSAKSNASIAACRPWGATAPQMSIAPSTNCAIKPANVQVGFREERPQSRVQYDRRVGR